MVSRTRGVRPLSLRYQHQRLDPTGSCRKIVSADADKSLGLSNPAVVTDPTPEFRHMWRIWRIELCHADDLTLLLCRVIAVSAQLVRSLSEVVFACSSTDLVQLHFACVGELRYKKHMRGVASCSAFYDGLTLNPDRGRKEL